MRALTCVMLVACYPGVDNSDCEIRCGTDGECPDNLPCIGAFCVDDNQTCVDPGLMLAYSFDDDAREMMLDQSGSGNSAGIAGAPTLIAGVFGKPMSFDGDGDYLVVRHSPSLAVGAGGAFTVSFWINVEPQAPFLRDQIIIAKVVKEDDVIAPFYEFGIEFDTDEELLELFVGDDQGQFVAAAKVTPPLGRFVHIAFTWNGTEAAGYLDGAKQGFTPNRSLDLTIPDRGQNLVIGSQSRPEEFFTGQLDDLRLYNRALSAAEIVTDLNNPMAR